MPLSQNQVIEIADFNKLTASLSGDHDLVLVSADGGQFQVHKASLAASSGVFRFVICFSTSPPPKMLCRNMFNVAKSDANDAVTTLTLTENATSFLQLLKFCYPIRVPPIDFKTSLDDTASIYEMAHKYEIVRAIESCEMQLKSVYALTGNPPRSYSSKIAEIHKPLTDMLLFFIRWVFLSTTQPCSS